MNNAKQINGRKNKRIKHSSNIIDAFIIREYDLIQQSQVKNAGAGGHFDPVLRTNRTWQGPNSKRNNASYLIAGRLILIIKYVSMHAHNLGE